MDHITVCICTYKRPELLKRLLNVLIRQKTDNLFTFSVVVTDNDKEQSAKKIVAACKASKKIDVEYYTSPERNIALTRNTAVKNTTGEYCAFIDDDEFPIDSWLLHHYKAMQAYNVTGILGPVEPHFDGTPPGWVKKGKLCHRKRYKTGKILHWKDTRTGNVLLKRDIFKEPSNYFDRNFDKGGEDVDFFRRLIKKNHTFIWCDEAIAYETVPTDRMTLSYFLKRAYLRGFISFHYLKKELTRSATIKLFLKSFLALVVYSPVLPFLFISGYALFAKYLIKATDHFSRCLAILRIINIRKRNF